MKEGMSMTKTGIQNQIPTRKTMPETSSVVNKLQVKGRNKKKSFNYAVSPSFV